MTDSALARRTYIGWTTRDGRHPVAVLDGSVMFPLSPGARRGASSDAWCPTPEALGAAILADLLGPGACCEHCAGSTCEVCEGTGLRAAGRDLLAPFVGEIVSALPESGFELPASSVLSWARAERALAPQPS